MDNEIKYFDNEIMAYRLGQTNKRLFILCLILSIMLFVSNGLWLYHESQFKYETTTIEAEQEITGGNGSNYVVGGSYGEDETKSKNN